MRRMVRMATLTLALVAGIFFIADDAKAACTTAGSPVASSDLTCTHVPGANEQPFRTWIANSWAPAAIEDYFSTLVGSDPGRNWSTSVHKIGYAYESWTSIEACCFSLGFREFGVNPGYYFYSVSKPGISATFHDERDFGSALLTITLTDYIDGVFHYTYTMARANWDLNQEESFGRFGPTISGVYSIASVPGPVAGAGLPALAALAYLLRRRTRRGRVLV